MDGKLDILSGCYWTAGTPAGQIQILKGAASMDFEKATALLSAAGKPLENVETKKDGRLSSADQIKNICTQQHAVDYDGDGDLDLIVGCYDHNFFYYENEGSDTENKLVEKPIEMDILSPDEHSAPHLVDFDGDGDLDFLTGGSAGGAYIAINTGSRKQPHYEDFTKLLDKPENPYAPRPSDELTIGAGTRVWATDFNGDGLMDLLIGDVSAIARPAKGVSDEEYRTKKAEHVKRKARLLARFQELEKTGREISEEVRQEVFKICGKFNSSTRGFERADRTGCVWLLLQKPNSKTGTEVTQN